MSVRIDPKWLSPERFAEYTDAAGGDLDVASRLYEWNAEVSAALFEIIHHFEVLLRNMIVEKVNANAATPSPRLTPGTPWTQGAKQIQEVEARLRRPGKDVTAGRIYSGLTFGFWQNMFGLEYEELWRHALQYVFRHARADRGVIAASLESVNQLRNRIAHHASLVDFDTGVEAEKILRLAGWIDTDAAAWIRSIERVSAITALRPVVPFRNVVVVPAADAWPLYDKHGQHAYVFPVGRSVRLVDHLAFYADQELKPVIPKILHRYIAVDWNKANAARLAKSSADSDRRLAKVIQASQNKGWNASAYQVLLLSGPKDEESTVLASPITHGRRGRGSAFARGHRYHSLGELMSAKDTDDLPDRPK